MKAYIVFTPDADLWWLRFLKRGYRHCFALLNNGKQWISIDPLSPHMDITVHDVPYDYDLPAWLDKQGHKVLAAPYQRHSRKPAPWALFSCVEVVKRVLGIRSVRVITPYQLYRFVEKYHARNRGV